MNLPRLAIEKKAISTAFMILLMIWGLIVLANISRREDPKIVMRSAMLITLWPGAEAEKVEQLVTRPLEKAIKEIGDVKRITSNSRVGVSAITVILHDNIANVDTIWNKIRSKIDGVQPNLPQGTTAPDLNTDFGETAAMVLAMYQIPLPGESKCRRLYTMREMDDMLKEVEDYLQEIPMVGKIEKFGLQPEVIYIEIDARQWAQLAITGPGLARIIDNHNTIAPGGTISSANINYAIKPSGEFISPQQIETVIVASQHGAPIRLSDLQLKVSRRYEEPPSQYTRFCAPDYPSSEKTCRCVIMSLAMLDGYNVIELGQKVQEKLDEFQGTTLPPDIAIEIVSDTPSRVDAAITDFLKNLGEAIIIVLAVALLIIGLRISIIMAAAIPLSIITAIGTMSLFHVDLEQCSIAALIIALGMLVDNAVVVSDNVLRLMETGTPQSEVAWRGAQELFVPILTSTLTTVAAFLPMLIIPGNNGEYIRSLPIVVSSTLLISLVVAMTVTPMMCHLLLRKKRASSQEDSQLRTLSASEPISSGILGRYGRWLTWCLDHKLAVIAIAMGLFLSSLLLIPVIGTAFFPKGLRDQFVISIELPAGSSLAHTNRVVSQVERALLRHGAKKIHGRSQQRFKNAVTYVGQSGPRFFISINPEAKRTYYAQMMVNTTSKWYTQGLVEDLRPRLDQIPGCRIRIRTLDMGPPINNPIELRLRGEDPQVLSHLAQAVAGQMRRIPGTCKVHDSWGNKSYQLAVTVNQEAANLAGVSHLHIASSLYSHFSGMKVTTYREGRHQIDVVLRVNPEQRQNLDYLDYLYVEGQNGKVPLNAVANVELRWQMSLIQRRNLIRTIEVCADVAPGYLSNKVVQNLLPQIKKNVTFPPGYWMEIGGEFEKTQKSQAEISVALKISLLLIVVILIGQFNSYIKPFIILLTLPLALIGALCGLFISGWPLGFMPILGIVSLCGVVVNNAIILIDFMDMARQAGTPLRAAVIRAGQLRMRPICITTLTTVGGFIPLALFGGPLWEGLAYVMICGLLVSTIFTLVVIPVVYHLFADKLKLAPK